MRSLRLLEKCIELEPKSVLDVGVGRGEHMLPFLANGATVTGIDVIEPEIEHERYLHIQSAYEQADITDEFDLVWCSHTLEHTPNVQHCLMHLRRWTKKGGYLAITVPSNRQNRIHIGHLTLWTPAHLIYNLICAGWDCREANWYSEYIDIALLLQKTDDIDMSWRTGMPNEIFDLNQFTPFYVRHESGAWWGNNWFDDFEATRVPDPPSVTIGYKKTNLPPELQLAYGPNPELRVPRTD